MDIARKIPAIIGLFCLNFFLVIWLFVSLYSVVFSIWATAGAMILSGFVTSVSSILYNVLKDHIFFGMSPILTLLAGLIVLVIGLLGINLSIYISKWTVKLTKKYIKWNADIISDRRGA